MVRAAIVLIALLAACGARSGDGASGVDSGRAGGDGPTLGITYVFAHTAASLYRIDPNTLEVVKIGDFTFPSGADQITDIAIDKAGTMIGISFTAVYQIDPSTAAGTQISNGLSGVFNGLSFVPAQQVGQVGDDVLVATRHSDGAVFQIDRQTGATTQIGNMGVYSSSGDLVSVAGFGTVLTANGTGQDQLVRLAPQTFNATPIGAGIGFAGIWGIAYWKDRVFGFTQAGEFLVIDPSTGSGTLVQSGGPSWWGAAVSTLAPVLL